MQDGDFEVGDRVEITATRRGLEYYTIGEIGTVNSIADASGWPLVYFDDDNGESYVDPKHMKKITN